MLPSVVHLRLYLCCLSKPVGKGPISKQSRSSSHYAQMFLQEQPPPSPHKSADISASCANIWTLLSCRSTCFRGQKFICFSQSFYLCSNDKPLALILRSASGGWLGFTEEGGGG